MIFSKYFVFFAFIYLSVVCFGINLFMNEKDSCLSLKIDTAPPFYKNFLESLCESGFRVERLQNSTYCINDNKTMIIGEHHLVKKLETLGIVYDSGKYVITNVFPSFTNIISSIVVCWFVPYLTINICWKKLKYRIDFLNLYFLIAGTYFFLNNFIFLLSDFFFIKSDEKEIMDFVMKFSQIYHTVYSLSFLMFFHVLHYFLSYKR